MLSASALTLQVPGRVLCRGLNLAFKPGQVWALLGRNGCGKTTLVHALGGLERYARTAVSLEGSALAAVPRRQLAREIGMLLQHEESEFWGSALDYVLLGRFPHADPWRGFSAEDEQHAHAALDSVQLGALAGRHYATLSGGERQRTRIAQLLAQDPRAFLLDEPLQHLDLQHQVATLARFQRLAREDARVVIMVLHDALWAARYCSHALLMHNDGTWMSGDAREVLTRSNLERLYESPLAEVTYAEGRYFVPHV